MDSPLVNRDQLKNLMKNRMTYREVADSLGITATALSFKISGRNGRILPFNESEVQALRKMFGDSILNPAPQVEAKRKRVTL